MQTRRILSLLVMTSALLIANPAASQGQGFYLQQYNSTVTDLNRVIDRINTLKEDIKTERDFARGCSMLGVLISSLADAQVLSEKLADYAYRLDDMDNHRHAVDQHNAFLQERHDWESERHRLCK